MCQLVLLEHRCGLKKEATTVGLRYGMASGILQALANTTPRGSTKPGFSVMLRMPKQVSGGVILCEVGVAVADEEVSVLNV